MENEAGQQDKLIGQTLGNFQIVMPLGKGGMGRVYLATDHTLDRQVALKVMLRRLSEDDSLVRRFNREAKAAAQLNHPNIVQVYAVGVQGGMPYIAMEYVQGLTLDELLRRQGRFDWHQALEIAGQVAAALACAHAKGVIHRDIKPSNILLARDRRVRVADFGLAKLQTAESQLTSEGIFLGTPQYMSPEQCGTGEIVPASDLFSLGVVLYEMISGKRPFQGDTPAHLVKSITLDAALPLADLSPETPPPVSDMVMQLLSKAPVSRFPSGAELIHEIGRVESEAALDTPTMRLAPGDADAPTESWTSPVPPSPASPASPAPGPTSSASRWFTWRNAAIALAVIAALVVARAVVQRARNGRAGRTPAVNTRDARPVAEVPATHDQNQPKEPIAQEGVSVVPYTEAGTGLRLISWLDGPECVLAHAIDGVRDGVRDRDRDRARGRNLFVTINPIAQQWRTVGGSLLPPAPDNTAAALRPKFYAPQVTPGSAMHDAVAVLRPMRGGGPRSVHQELAVQRYDALDQDPRIVFKADPMGMHTNDADYFPGACHGVAFHPDGKRICLVLSRGKRRPGVRSMPSMFLAERGLEGEGLGKIGPALTPGISGVRNVHYSPDGGYIAYERMRTGGEELWLIPSGQGTPDEGVRVATAPSSFAAVAFNPTQSAVLVALRDKNAVEPELVLLGMSGDGVKRRAFGKGHISAHPWEPTGTYFAASSLDDDGRLCVWAHKADGQGDTVLLAQFPEGRAAVKSARGLSGPVVSRDGRWVAVDIPGDPPKLAFIDLYAHPQTANLR
ncbi:MAG: serine/threonine protein kinase [bacterium]|nr:serine/threonine protein kinase [bacterium]